ncbi:golgi apparatus membrane protein-like protein tvp23 [Aureobasidium sp. EXF-10727]|nr:golgi apparatus membrane protein-like protein tvp23 [Aureobasidium sp. EXF-10727]
MDNPQPGSLSWRLSSHPITLLCFLGFRLCKNHPCPVHDHEKKCTELTLHTASLLTYLFGLYFSQNYVLIFIITIILLAIDFYYLKNIAGRRLVGLRWWNEVNAQSGDGNWVFESADPDTRQINATDKRFFWLALYSQPVSWVALGIVAIFRLHFIWLSLVVIAIVLAVTNTLAFSRCDKFSQATNIATGAFSASGLASNLGGAVIGRFFR